MYKKLAHIMLAILAIAGLGLTGCMDGETPTKLETDDAAFNGANTTFTAPTGTMGGSTAVPTTVATYTAMFATNPYGAGYTVTGLDLATANTATGAVVCNAVVADDPKKADGTDNYKKIGSYNSKMKVVTDKNGNTTSSETVTTYNGCATGTAAGVLAGRTTENFRQVDGTVTSITETTWTNVGTKAAPSYQKVTETVTTMVNGSVKSNNGTETALDDTDVAITNYKKVVADEYEWNKVVGANNNTKKTTTTTVDEIKGLTDDGGTNSISQQKRVWIVIDNHVTTVENVFETMKDKATQDNDTYTSDEGRLNSGSGWYTISTPAARFVPWQSTSACPEAGHQTIKTATTTYDIVYNADQSVSLYKNGVLQSINEDCNGL